MMRKGLRKTIGLDVWNALVMEDCDSILLGTQRGYPLHHILLEIQTGILRIVKHF